MLYAHVDGDDLEVLRNLRSDAEHGVNQFVLGQGRKPAARLGLKHEDGVSAVAPSDEQAVDLDLAGVVRQLDCVAIVHDKGEGVCAIAPAGTVAG